jgi:hypothetical protein
METWRVLCISTTEIPTETTIRVLGVQVDARLRWKEHVQQAVQKGSMAFEALSRITASTWGPSMKRSRLLYTAVVRPAMFTVRRCGACKIMAPHQLQSPNH